MNPKQCKHYGTDDLDPTTLVETYFSPSTPKDIFRESTELQMYHIRKAFESGLVKGKHLIDLSLGPIIFQLLAVNEFVEEVTQLELNHACGKETNKWIERKDDCCNWTHVSSVILEKMGVSGNWYEREETLRRKLKVVTTCHLTKYESPEQSGFPKADCFFSIWGLDTISKDKEEFCSNLKIVSSYLNMGGYLLIYGDINATYFKIGKHKYHLLNYDESFLMPAIKDAGFDILLHENIERKCVTDLVDYKAILFIVAQKVKEV